jgi:hypothetical protein
VKKRLKNPFKFDVEVAGEFFCGRESDIDELSDYIYNTTNVIMFSKRRIGKSSLIKEVFENQLEDTVLKAHIDIYSISNTRELFLKLQDGVKKSLLYEITTIEKASMVISDIQKYFKNSKVSMVLSSSPELKIESGDKNYYVAIENLFGDYFDYLRAKNLTCVFAIDEFQKIVSLPDSEKIEELLRTIVNKRGELGSFIFTGSKRNILLAMFSDVSRAFFKLGSEMPLDSIELNTFYDWSRERFHRKNIFLDRTAFNYLYEAADGETRFIQQVCHDLFRKSDETDVIDEQIITKEIAHLIDKKSYIVQLFNKYSTPQQNALKIIVACSGREIYNKDMLEEYSITKQSLQSAIKALLKENTIFEENDKYTFEDVEFKLWIKSQLFSN